MADALYSYDRISGALLGTTAYVDNPERPDEPLLPAFATTVRPPDVPVGEAAVWNGSGWDLAPDHRGERWWKGTDPILIDAVGDPTALGLTAQPVTPPAPPPTSCSRLGLMRAFKARGLWETVRAMIAANSDLQEEWDLAVEIRKSDPLILTALGALTQLGIPFSDADVDALIADAVAAVAPPVQAAAVA